jgi:hypothetical protein
MTADRGAERSPAGGRLTAPAKNQLDPARPGCGATTPEGSSVSSLAGQSSGSTPGGSPPKTSTYQTRCINRRVDALVVAYQLDVDDAVRDELGERQAIADEAGTAELRVSDFAFAIRRSRKLEAFYFENADVHCAFDERASAGWKLEIVFRAAFLATHSLAETLALAKRIARGFGSIAGDRLRRFDMAADFEGFPLDRDDADRIVTTRAGIASFSTEAKDTDDALGQHFRPDLADYRRANHQVTGFTIAPGNPLMARIYNKTTELSLPGREQKRAIEHTVWGDNGWDGHEPVTRVEFQLRGEMLDEIGLRNPGDLESNLDATWCMCTKWLRFVEPGTATRACRCTLDPRWVAVARVVFFQQAPPIVRRRVRGGASAAHVLGAVRSLLASNGKLGRINLPPSEDGEVPSEKDFAEGLTEAQAELWVHAHASCVFPQAGRHVALSLLQQYGPKGAVERLIAKNNAKVARFSSADDDRTEERKSRP